MLPSTASARRSFLELPFHLRLLSHQHSSRAFSATASTKIDFAEVFAAPPLAVLNGLHAVGIPWYAAIPTTAILLRGVFGYYFAAAPARRRMQIRSHLSPLASATLDLRFKQEIAKGTGKPKSKASERALDKWIRHPYARHTLGKKFGAGVIAITSFVNFPTLIATTEAVRMKCGARDGLLSLLATPFNWLGRIIAPDFFPAAARTAAHDEALATRLEQIREARTQHLQDNGLSNASGNEVMSGNLYEAFTPPPPPLINTDAPYFDSSLTTEGLSWCTDLTAPDPTGVLPVMTFAVIVGNILLTPRPVDASKVRAGAPAWQNYLRQRVSGWSGFGIVVACAFEVLMQRMPAAIVLYLLSSVLTTLFQRRWLNVAMPLRPAIQRCTRGTRVRSKKEWSARH